MTDQMYDVLGIGNAIVDVLARTNDDFLVENNLHKGSMRLIDTDEAERLYAAMGTAVEVSGGSAANTCAGLASFGGSVAYIGKVADDTLGSVFEHDIKASGVHFDTPKLTATPPTTARSMILVTPDGERTMNTYLGACVHLTPEDIDEEQVSRSAMTYLEGYLWDPEEAKKAFVKASQIAHKAGRKVALSLSDSFCVDRFRDEFLGLMRDGTLDMIFANESELHALYQTASTASALDALRADIDLAAITLGEKGSMAVTKSDVISVDAEPIDHVEDATGAGDLYAAGFLMGMSRGLPLATSAKLGGLAAAEIIQQIGARSQKSLKDLASQHGIAL